MALLRVGKELIVIEPIYLSIEARDMEDIVEVIAILLEIVSLHSWSWIEVRNRLPRLSRRKSQNRI
jgi:hypothetical protein